MTEFQTVAARLANNLLTTNQSNYAEEKTSLEVEYVTYVLLMALADTRLVRARELVTSMVSNFIGMLQTNNEALHMVLKKELTIQQYVGLELENYKRLADYVHQLTLDTDSKSAILGCLTALDTDSLRPDGEAYLIDEYQHQTVMRLRKEWFLNEFQIEHVPFAVFYNTQKQS